MKNGGSYRVAIVGASTLKGRELADMIKDRNFPARDVRLLDDDESLGQLEAVGDEVSFVQSIRPEQFEGVDIALFASEEGFTLRHWEQARDKGCGIVDLSYALEKVPGARVRAPWLERELGQTVAPDLTSAPVVTAHPAAQVLALLMVRAQKAGAIKTATAVVMEPASEKGRRGMDELHEQTVNLLSFRELPKQVFDAQVAFNMLGAYGAKAQPTLESIERRIAAHFQKIVAGRAPVPSLMLVQSPSFHGHTFSVYIELTTPASANAALAGGPVEQQVAIGDFERALSGEHVMVSHGADEVPSNVNAAGQDEVLVRVRRDAARENGFWLWIAADNLRITAITALDCAERLAAARPKGTVQ
jgi:aspartate-semialdehyde dehydrogenase